MTALCGLSGAGKSTIAALLERFYEPQGGRIYLDQTPLDKLDPSWLREEVIGFINQEPVLFATSILENIRYGRPSASDEEVMACDGTLLSQNDCMSGSDFPTLAYLSNSVGTVPAKTTVLLADITPEAAHTFDIYVHVYTYLCM